MDSLSNCEGQSSKLGPIIKQIRSGRNAAWDSYTMIHKDSKFSEKNKTEIQSQWIGALKYQS